MKGVVIAVAIALLGTATALQAKEADSPRAELRSSAGLARQLATSAVAPSRNNAERAGQNRRSSPDFSAERIVPDICRGC